MKCGTAVCREAGGKARTRAPPSYEEALGAIYLRGERARRTLRNLHPSREGGLSTSGTQIKENGGDICLPLAPFHSHVETSIFTMQQWKHELERRAENIVKYPIDYINQINLPLMIK